MQSSTIKVKSGNSIETGIWGSPSDPKLLFFHGFGGAMSIMPWAEAWLEEQHLCVIAVNRPGVGKSTLSAKYSMQEYLEEVKQILDGMGIREMIVCGWSAGALYAMHFANIWPQCCSRLILFSSAPLFSPFFQRKLPLRFRAVRRINRYLPSVTEYLTSLTARNVTKDVNITWNRLIRQARGRDKAILTDPAIAAIGKRATEEAWGYGGKAMYHDALAVTSSGEIDLRRLRMPVHLWQGTEDHITPPVIAKLLAAGIPCARLHLLPESGHFMCLGHLKEFIGQSLSEVPVEAFHL